MRGPEGRLQDTVVAMYRRYGWLCTKNSAGGGWADFTFIGPCGYILFVEFKSNRGNLSRIQQAWHKDVLSRFERGKRTEYMCAVVWSDKMEAARFLRDYNARNGIASD